MQPLFALPGIPAEPETLVLDLHAPAEAVFDFIAQAAELNYTVGLEGSIGAGLAFLEESDGSGTWATAVSAESVGTNTRLVMPLPVAEAVRDVATKWASSSKCPCGKCHTLRTFAAGLPDVMAKVAAKNAEGARAPSAEEMAKAEQEAERRGRLMAEEPAGRA